jgi:hypothetical protein
MEDTLSDGVYDAISRLVYHHGVKRPGLVNPGITLLTEVIPVIEPVEKNEPHN